jgi:hypothetical protein
VDSPSGENDGVADTPPEKEYITHGLFKIHGKKLV